MTQFVMKGEYMNKVSQYKAILSKAARKCPRATHIVESVCASASCGGEATPRNGLEEEGGGGAWTVEEKGGGCITERSCGC